jgi:biopolymer transport protein ExbD
VRLGTQAGLEEPEINLISLIDVLFCLILFLVLTTSFNQRAALKLQLPKAEAPTVPDQGTPLIILVDLEGKFFVGNAEVPRSDLASLKAAIAAAAGEDRDRQVILRADGRTPHQSVVTAMDALGQLGFERLSIATMPEQRKP